MKKRFGKVYDRDRAIKATGLQIEPSGTGSSPLLNETEGCAGALAEDVLAVNNATNSEDEVVELIIDIACIIYQSAIIMCNLNVTVTVCGNKGSRN